MIIKRPFLFLFISFMITISAYNQADTKKIVLVTPAYEPFYGPGLKNDGYVSAIVKEVFKRLGYKLEISYMPWGRALKMARSGKYQGLLGAYYHRDREADFFYSLPLETVNVVFVCHKSLNISSYTALKELIPYRIGIVRGYVNEEAFDKVDYLNKFPSNSSEDNLENFMNGRLDIIVDTRQLIKYLIGKEYPERLEQVRFLEPPLKSQNLHVIFSKKIRANTTLVRDFNKVLRQMIDTGEVEKIKAEYNQ